MRHTTGENKRVKTKSEELENLFGTLLLDLGSRIEDNEINIKFATNFKAKYKSRFEKIIENNVALGSSLIEIENAYIEDADTVNNYDATGRVSKLWITKEDFDKIKCINN